MTRTSLLLLLSIAWISQGGCAWLRSFGPSSRGSTVVAESAKQATSSLAATARDGRPTAKSQDLLAAKPQSAGTPPSDKDHQPGTADVKKTESLVSYLAQEGSGPNQATADTQKPEPETLPPTMSRLDSFREELADGTLVNSADPLQLAEVVQSVTASFPLIQAALVEGQVADGKQISSFGEFDLKLKAESLNMPRGFYQNYRHLLKAEQGTWQGGTVYGQYRLGDGDFQPWYGERETNEGGEFKVGLLAPLLRDRQIDERRTELLKANLARAAVEPVVREQILESVQIASNVYWTWVAAGQAYQVNRDLLRLTRERNRAIELRVKKGDLPLVELQQNERLIATREAKLIEAQRKLQNAAIKLSIFYRDADGRPVVPPVELLPPGFPPLTPPVPQGLQSDLDRALGQRPELQNIAVQRQQVEMDLGFNQNQLLPNLSAVVDASKDMGQAASSKGDKTPFELEAGLVFDMPVQRRKALGKIQSSQGKITQLAWKQQLTENKIRAEVQDSVSALIAAFERVEQLRRSLDFAKRLVVAEQRSFDLGNSDLLRVALQEAAALDAEILLIDALADYFRAQADYRAALGENSPLP